MEHVISISIVVSYFITSLYLLIKGFSFSLRSFLEEDQKREYDDMISERIRIYISSTLLAIPITFVFILNNKQEIELLFYSTFVFFFMIQFSLYMIYPKKHEILFHLTTMSQVNIWMKDYNCLKDNMIYVFNCVFLSCVLLYQPIKSLF